jgi:hypothetical protein
VRLPEKSDNTECRQAESRQKDDVDDYFVSLKLGVLFFPSRIRLCGRISFPFRESAHMTLRVSHRLRCAEKHYQNKLEPYQANEFNDSHAPFLARLTSYTGSIVICV